jgi:hypothetical protein
MSSPFDMVDEEFYRIMQSVTREVVGRSNADNVASSLWCFLVRVQNTWSSVRLLRNGTPVARHNEILVDVGVLLRCMFDASLQAAYILHDPAKQTERASQYLEFQHVERYNTQERVFKHKNMLTDLLRLSRHKAAGQARVKAEFDRVKNQFLKKSNKNSTGGVLKGEAETREQWYAGNLGQFAQDAGKRDEYDTFIYGFHGCVHSSSYAVLEGPPLAHELVMPFANALAGRVVAINARYHRLDLGRDQAILDEICKGALYPS